VKLIIKEAYRNIYALFEAKILGKAHKYYGKANFLVQNFS
jgi:hypothetical protein